MTSLIQSLPTEVVYQIAAGEVIDSLAAVVRELAENALDAQANRITVALWPEQGQVQVADDGVGMALADLQRAATPHSTSKICSQADLWQIKSLGFRGQALHSLSQVGTLEICSRPQADAHNPGWRVKYSPEGEVQAVGAVAIAPGTIVTVSNLFATWPARQQALPTIPQQLRAVQLGLQQMALCHPQVTFQAELRGRSWLALAPAAEARERLPQILKTLALSDLRDLSCPVYAPGTTDGPTAGNPLQPTEVRLGDLYLLIGLPDRCHRQRADWIKIAVNGRQVHLPEVEQVVIRAFRFTLPRDRYPLCFVHLRPHPSANDWNRHPDKSTLYQQGLDIWTQAVGQAITDLLRFNVESFSPGEQQRRAQQFLKTAESVGQYSGSPDAEDSQPPAVSPLPLLKAVAQVQNRYILAEHSSGICLIEQHIAHERVLYEQLQQQWRLVPLEAPLILERLSEVQVNNLQQLQLEIAPFGPQIWAVRTVPAPLAQREDLADALLELSLTGQFDQALVAVACRTAIRNGTPLPLDFLQTLLQTWQQTRNPHTCPHGRPICLALEETSLARFFKRHWVIGKSHGI